MTGPEDYEAAQTWIEAAASAFRSDQYDRAQASRHRLPRLTPPSRLLRPPRSAAMAWTRGRGGTWPGRRQASDYALVLPSLILAMYSFVQAARRPPFAKLPMILAVLVVLASLVR